MCILSPTRTRLEIHQRPQSVHNPSYCAFMLPHLPIRQAQVPVIFMKEKTVRLVLFPDVGRIAT